MAKGRILIITDDVDVSKMLQIYFNGQGHEVLITHRGREALDICRTKSPQVVILGIQLSDIDGYEVCRILKNDSLTHNISIIFLSELREQSDKIAALELGADDFVSKPFDIEELKLRVEGAIRRSYLRN